MITDKIKALDDALFEISSKISLSALQPLNIAEIRRRFRDGVTINYSNPTNFQDKIEELNGMSFPDTFEGNLLRRKRDELVLKAKLVMSVGTKEFNKYSRLLYPPPDERLIKEAKRILSLENRLSRRVERKLLRSTPDEKISLQRAYTIISDTMSRLGLMWKVNKTHIMAADANVMPSVRVFNIKRKPYFSRRFIDRLIIHEIGTHIFRAENGRNQELKILMYGLPGYLDTEEGLAAYNEYVNSLEYSLSTYALRVLAVSLSDNPLRKMVYELMKYVSESRALTAAIRAKRGVGHSDDPGGYTKDAVYLRGFLKVRAFVEEGGSLDDLYIGKVGLDDLRIIKELEWIRSPLYSADQVSTLITRQ